MLWKYVNNRVLILFEPPIEIIKLNHVMRIPVFVVRDQVILKPACPATETSYGIEILDLAS